MKTLSAHWQRGSVLLESLISVLIFSIGLIGLVGLASQALNQSGQSKARNDASNLASELVADMWINGASVAAFDDTAWQARVAANLPGGAATLDRSDPSGTRVTIVITWSDPKNQGVQHSYTTTAQIAKN